MKSFLTFALFLIFCISLNGQTSVKLPIYYEGQFSSDTAFKFFGPMDENGDGSITFQNKLTDTLLTDVSFYVLIDSVDKAGAPANVNTVYVTGANNTGGIAKKGDKYKLPVNFKLFAGKIGFTVLIEGTPTINNESYYCDLELLLPTCNCMDAVFRNKTEQTCNVVAAHGVQAAVNNEVSFIVYPNPITHTAMIRASSNYVGKPYAIIDNNGKRVLNGIISDGTTTIDINHLPSGNYYIQVQDIRKVLSIIK